MPAQHVVASEDVIITVPAGQHGEGQHQIRANQPVPLEFVDAYKAEVGDAQFDKETQSIPHPETVKGHGQDHSGVQINSGVAPTGPEGHHQSYVQED